MDQLSIRDEIEELNKECKGHEKLSEVNKYVWKTIIGKIEDKFIHKQHYSEGMHWGWQRLKEPQYVLSLVVAPERYLQFFVNDELIWFIVEDYQNKMWLYEGYTSFIRKVIPELVHLREYYIISKKYEWLLCVNHHGIVFGSGAELVAKMKKFEQINPEEVIKRNPQ